jgi:hypothetical protein
MGRLHLSFPGAKLNENGHAVGNLTASFCSPVTLSDDRAWLLVHMKLSRDVRA